jgi:hypothetical protein
MADSLSLSLSLSLYSSCPGDITEVAFEVVRVDLISACWRPGSGSSRGVLVVVHREMPKKTEVAPLY